MKTVFLRVLEAENKAAALLEAIREPKSAIGQQRFEMEPGRFARIPRSPFAYWVTERVSEVFSRLPKMEDGGRTIKVGVQTFNDPRFLRLAWEVCTCNDRSKWFPFAKGGSHSPYYSDVHLLVNFFDTGREIAAFKYAHRPREGLQHRAVEYYVRPGLTWPRRTSGLSMRAMPAGCVFADKGPAVFVENDEIGNLLALACITNARVFRFLVSLQLARTELAQSYEVGLIQTTPVPDLTASDQEALAGLARRSWSLKRRLDTRTETSLAFSLPAVLQVSGADIAARTAAWSEHIRAVETELVALQTQIDERCFVLFGIDEAHDRSSPAPRQIAPVPLEHLHDCGAPQRYSDAERLRDRDLPGPLRIASTHTEWCRDWRTPRHSPAVSRLRDCSSSAPRQIASTHSRRCRDWSAPRHSRAAR